MSAGAKQTGEEREPHKVRKENRNHGKGVAGSKVNQERAERCLNIPTPSTWGLEGRRALAQPSSED